MKNFFKFKKADTIYGRLWQFLGILLAIAAGVLLFSLVFHYRCPIRYTLGVSCPACGMTRAANCLLCLDFAGAWGYHPLIYSLPVFAVVLGYAYVWDKRELLHSKWLWNIFIVLFIAFWFWRLMRFFGGNDPAFLEPGAVFPTVLRKMTGR